MAMKLASAYVEISAKDQGFQRAVNDMESDVRERVNGLGTLLGQLGMGATAGALVGAGIKLATTAEQTEAAFDIILKDVDRTRALLAQLNQFSVVTPFEPGEIRQAARALLAFRTEAEEIEPTLQIIGDLAAGSGAQLGELIRIYNKVKSVGKLTAETFEQFAERGVNVQAELAEMLGKTSDEIVEMRTKGEISFEMVRKAMARSTAEGGMFYNAMADQAKTAEGLMSTLAGNVKSLTAALGTALLPAYKAVLKFQIAITDQIRNLNDATGGFIMTTAAATAGVVALTASLMAARTAAQMLGLTMRKVLVASGVGVILVALGAAIALIVKITSTIAKSEPVVAAWQANVEKFAMAWDRIKTAALNAWNAIKQAVAQAVQTIAGMFGVELGTMTTSVQGFAADAIGALADWVLNAAEWLQVFSENWGTAWEIAKNTVAIALIFVRDLFTTNLTTIMGYAWGRQLRLVVDFFTQLVKIAWKAITTVGEILGKVFSNVWQGIKNLFAGKGFGDIMAGALDTLVKEASDFGEAFAAGWNKENPFDLMETSEAMKRALAEQEKLFARLAEGKAELERERGGPEAPGPEEEEPGKPTGPKAPPTATVKLEAGFFGFDQLQKSIQENVLKGESADEKLVKQGDAAAMAREEMNTHLKAIKENVEEPVAVAAS